MKKCDNLLRVILLSAVIVLAMGLGFGRSHAAAPNEPINIGVITSLTGPVTALGHDVRDSILVGVDEINSKGGVLGRPVRAIVRDDQSLPATYTREGEKLASTEHIAAVIGVVHGGMVAPMVTLAQKYNIPAIAGSTIHITQHEMVIGKGPKQYFASLPSTSNHGLVGASFILKDLGKKRIYIIGNDYIYGQENLSMYEKATALVPEAKVVGSDLTPLGTVDFSALLSKVRRAKPDCLVAVTWGQDTINLLNQAHEFGMLGKEMIAYVDFGTGYTFESAVVREALQYTYWGTPFYWELPLPSTKAFANIFTSRYGRIPAAWGWGGYVMVRMWADAVRRAGTVKGDAVCEALLKTKSDYGNGELTVRSLDHTTVGTMLICRGKRPENIKSPYGWDLLEVVTKKSGEKYGLTREELMSYPVKLTRLP